MVTYLSLSFKEIIRRRRRALHTASGIALASALAVFIFLASSCLKKSFSGALGEVGADIVVQAHGEPCVWAPVKLPTNLNPIPASMVEKLRQIKGVAKASGILICWAFDGEKGNLHPSVIAGVEPLERDLGPLRLSSREGSGNLLVKGRYLNEMDLFTAVIDYDFARFLRVGVSSQVYFGGNRFEVVGIVKTGREARIAGAQAFIPLRVAQELLKRGDVVNTIFVRLEASADLKNTIRRLKKLFGENSSVTASTDFPSLVMGLAAFADIFAFGIFIVIGLAALAMSARSVSASISERMREICVMKAVGWTYQNIRGLLFTESVIIGLAASAAGAFLGIAFSWLYLNSVQLRLPEALAAYPPCSTTPPKLEVALAGYTVDAAAVFITVAAFTVLSGAAALFSSRAFRDIECAEGLRSL